MAPKRQLLGRFLPCQSVTHIVGAYQLDWYTNRHLSNNTTENKETNLSYTRPWSSDWLLSLPVPHWHSPESFRCCLQYQLLIPIFQEGSKCSYCLAVIHLLHKCSYCLRELDVRGDHAVHCTSGADVALSAGTTPFAMALLQSLLQLDPGTNFSYTRSWPGTSPRRPPSSRVGRNT
jgi:hypothetical protein